MPAANGIYMLKVIGTVAGQQHIHTLHFRSTAFPGALTQDEPTYMTALVASWQGAPATAYRALFTTPFSPVQQFQVRKVCGTAPLPAGVDITQTTGQTAGTGGTTGTFGSEPAAPWLATVTTERSALAGRRYRGRYFIGGLHEDHFVGATIAASRLTLLTAYSDALMAAYVTPADLDVGWSLFVYSKTQATEFPATPCQNTGADVIGFQNRDQLATMKSRKAGSGI